MENNKTDISPSHSHGYSVGKRESVEQREKSSRPVVSEMREERDIPTEATSEGHVLASLLSGLC
jgi:hypothetical protein